MPLVYVMTPVYNGEAFLRECIESVLKQTYANWVYTIVNNHSTDRTLEIAREYAARDARIRIHDNACFLPVFDNWNLGYSLVPPDTAYCKPLMADDWLYPECIGEMVRIAEANPSVGLVCSRHFDGTLWKDTPGSGPITHGRDICRATLFGKLYVFGSPTTELIRADLIRKRQPFCNPLNPHPDFEACLDVLQESDFAFIDRPLAFNRVHDRSITSQYQSYETNAVGVLFANVKFGPIYLTGDEHRDRLEQVFDEYYFALTKHVSEGRAQTFREFHRQHLQTLGYTLDDERLARLAEDVRRLQVRVDRAMQTINVLVPEDARVILVDDDAWRSYALRVGRPTVPFLEKDGEYWGRPDNDATAIQELERLRQAGARVIVFAWQAFWWLDYYSGFREYLQARFQCLMRNDDMVLFDLNLQD